MIRLFSIARAATVAALALGAGALLAPAPAEAQSRQGFSTGGARMGSVGRVAGPRMGTAPRMSYRAPRGYAPTRAVAPRVVTYRHSGYRPGVRPLPRYDRRYRGGYYPYWPAAVGVGVGLASASYYANSGYYTQQCWTEHRTVRTTHGPRLMRVRVCPIY
jgi:hypothetical protein